MAKQVRDEGARMNRVGLKKSFAARLPGPHRKPMWNPGFRFHPSSFIFHLSSFLLVLTLLLQPTSVTSAQNDAQRSGAHSAKNTFTAADRRLVERAIGATCTERVRDPLGSLPIDEMQSRPSLPTTHPDAVAGLQRAERLLPATRKLVTDAIVKLAKEYDLYDSGIGHAKISAATARVEAVRHVKPDVDARDNASVLLREPHTIEFGTIFLASLHSDEAMISVLSHELTHIASGQSDTLKPLFRAIAKRAASRTGLHISGQRAEELSCDLVGAIAAREYIKENSSWESLPRRLARAFEHNCVDDDESDEDHLSPRNTIRALFALEVFMASEMVGEGVAGLSFDTSHSFLEENRLVRLHNNAVDSFADHFLRSVRATRPN